MVVLYLFILLLTLFCFLTRESCDLIYPFLKDGAVEGEWDAKASLRASQKHVKNLEKRGELHPLTEEEATAVHLYTQSELFCFTHHHPVPPLLMPRMLTSFMIACAKRQSILPRAESGSS